MWYIQNRYYFQVSFTHFFFKNVAFWVNAPNFENHFLKTNFKLGLTLPTLPTLPKGCFINVGRRENVRNSSRKDTVIKAPTRPNYSLVITTLRYIVKHHNSSSTLIGSHQSHQHCFIVSITKPCRTSRHRRRGDGRNPRNSKS